MGYVEVFEDDEATRCIYGVYPRESRSAWIMTLDYLLPKVVDQGMIDRLTFLYTKWNLGSIPSTTPVVVDSSIVYWGVGEPSATTEAEVLAMNQAVLINGSMTLLTGTVETKFKLAIHPAHTISQVIDWTAGPIPVTNQYVFIGTILVNGFNYGYWEMTTIQPYTATHSHEVSV